jgi:hypothetical protein
MGEGLGLHDLIQRTLAGRVKNFIKPKPSQGTARRPERSGFSEDFCRR